MIDRRNCLVRVYLWWLTEEIVWPQNLSSCFCTRFLTVAGTDGQETTCSVFNCDLDCGLPGYQVDENDCMICECYDDQDSQQEATCPAFNCDLDCGISGYQVDENDCMICECYDDQDSQQEATCPAFNCDLDCGISGYQVDENDCMICECYDDQDSQQEATCPAFNCDLDCGISGYQVDENDCLTCECNIYFNSLSADAKSYRTMSTCWALCEWLSWLYMSLYFTLV